MILVQLTTRAKRFLRKLGNTIIELKNRCSIYGIMFENHKKKRKGS